MLKPVLLYVQIAFLSKTTKMKTQEERLAAKFQERLLAWKNKQIGQTDGYEYERSFAEMMRQIEEEVFKEMAGTELNDKNKKKRSGPAMEK